MKKIMITILMIGLSLFADKGMGAIECTDNCTPRTTELSTKLETCEDYEVAYGLKDKDGDKKLSEAPDDQKKSEVTGDATQ